MKIVYRQEFMELPIGIFFQEYFDNRELSHLYIKGETIVHHDKNIDFYYLPVDAEVNIFDGNVEFPWGQGRDGSFDDNQKYLIYEEEDVKILKYIVNNPEKFAKEGI